MGMSCGMEQISSLGMMPSPIQTTSLRLVGRAAVSRASF